jgi:cob(I)alamin adenosyltransferase
MKSQVTTGKGDGGETRILGGEVLPKSHPVLECTGSLDTLRAHLALLRLEAIKAGHDDLGGVLLWVIHSCFLMGTAINDPKRRHPEYRIEDISEKHLRYLEAEQARLEAETPLPRAFIAAAACPAAAWADLTATVARTLERNLVRLKEAEPDFEAEAILAYVNRLSDFLFIAARRLEEGRHQTVDYSVLDITPAP